MWLLAVIRVLYGAILGRAYIHTPSAAFPWVGMLAVASATVMVGAAVPAATDTLLAGNGTEQRRIM